MPAELIADFNRIGLADSALAAPRGGFAGVVAYPDFATKAAALCWHLVKNHPLPDGNKRCAFLATVEFVERNGRKPAEHRSLVVEVGIELVFTETCRRSVQRRRPAYAVRRRLDRQLDQRAKELPGRDRAPVVNSYFKLAIRTVGRQLKAGVESNRR